MKSYPLKITDFFSISRFSLPIIFCFFGQLSFLAFATINGIGISADSVTYLSSATSFSSNLGLKNFQGEPLTIFPPSYPLILGFFHIFGIDIQVLALIINYASFALCLYFFYKIVLRIFNEGATAKFLLISAIFSLSVFKSYVMLWTEPMFSAVVMGVAYLLSRMLDRKTVTLPESFFVAFLILSAASLRYIGVVLMVPFVLTIFILTKSASKRFQIATYSSLLIPVLGILLIMQRNLSHNAGVFGNRATGGFSFLEICNQIVITLGRLILPIGDELPSVLKIIGLCLCILVFVSVLLAFRDRNLKVLIFSVFTLSYFALLAFSGMVTIVDPISDRQTAPVALFILLNIAYVLNYFATKVNLKQGIEKIGHLLLIGIISINLIFTSVFVFQSYQNGIGMNSKDFNSSSLSGYLTRIPSDKLASNDPFSIYMLSGRSAFPIPIIGNHYWSQDARIAQDRELIKKIDKESEIYVVLLGGENFDDQLERFLVNNLVSEEVFRSKLGSVFRLHIP